MGSASLVFWCRTARSRRAGHQCSLRVILRELCVTAPCMGESVSVLVDGLPPCGTGHFASFDIFTPSFLLPGNLSPIGPRRPTVSEFWLSHLREGRCRLSKMSFVVLAHTATHSVRLASGWC